MKKNLCLNGIVILLLVAGFLFGLAPICLKTAGQSISLYQSINYLDLGRICAGNLITVIFMASGALLILLTLVLNLVKPKDLAGLKVFLLVIAMLLILTAGALYGCAYILFRYHGPIGVSIEGTQTDGFTKWGAIVGSIVTLLAGILVMPIIVSLIPRKEVKPY